MTSNDPVVYEVELQDKGMCKQKEEELKETKNHNTHTSRKAFESMALIKNRRGIVGSKEENKKGRKNK